MKTLDQIRLALVDDDPNLCHAMTRLFRGAGIKLATYPSAEIFLAEAAPTNLDCLLLDIELGGMSGFELRQQLATSHASLPVIFLTGLEEPAVREQAMRMGCAAFLRKTDSWRVLLAAVQRATGANGMLSEASADPALQAQPLQEAN